MASRLNASDVLNIDWGRRARDILEKGKRDEAERLAREAYAMRAPELHLPWASEPVEIPEKNFITDPNSWLNKGLNRLVDDASTVILGEGTGNMKADLALGLLGPGAGIATEAAGGNSGLLDWMPGGGVAKAGVVAIPKVVRSVTHIGQRVAADDAVDLMRDIAQTVVDRLARVNDHIVSPDEIKRAVFDEVSNLGNINGASLIRENATNMATDVLNKAKSAIQAGEIPDLMVKSPKTVAFSSRALYDPVEVDPETLRAAKRQFNADMTAKFKELPEEIQQDISRRADEVADDAVRTAMETGDLKGNRDYAMLKASVAYRARNSFTNKYLKELEQANQPPKEFVKPNSMMTDNLNVNEEINRAGREAGQAAYDEAIRNGLSIQEAKHAREIARDRARYAKRKELGGDAINNRRTALRANSANVRHAFDILSPEIQDEITKGAEVARDEAKKTVQEYGGLRREMNKKGATAYHGYIERTTRQILQELGFKNANDPRLAQYSQLRRDGNHVLATPTEQVLMAEPNMTPFRPEPAMAEAAAPVKDYDVTPSQILGTTPSRRLLPEDEFSDADIASLLREYGEVPTGDLAFDREYAEELMREAGY